MSEIDAAAFTEMRDREAIRDCLARYSRGVDRRDRALFESVYWPDAHDDHVRFTGNALEFIDWALNNLKRMEITQHFLGNTLIRMSDATAAVETYFSAYHRMQVDGVLTDILLGGRYVDRMEKRGEEWRIALRRVIADWHRSAPSQGSVVNFGLGPYPVSNIGTVDGGDPSFALFGA